MVNNSYIIIGLIIIIILYLVLREVNCWYWKINERVRIAETQTILLQKILRKLGDEFEHTLSDSSNEEITQSQIKFDPESGINQRVYDLLSDKEKEEANRFIRFGIQENQTLAIKKDDRKIDRFDKKEWKKIVEESEDSNWMIICKK